MKNEKKVYVAPQIIEILVIILEEGIASSSATIQAVNSNNKVQDEWDDQSTADRNINW